MNNTKRFVLRTKITTYLKLQEIAKLNKRSTNKQIEFIIEKFIDEYEKFNGNIDIKEILKKQ